MPNTFFQFKQFVVHQGQTAMKVCTDACVFGALIPPLLKPQAQVLDIGAGTGLLALMMAQRSEAHITGVEIDASAATQALENVRLSPWTTRIEIVQAAIQEFAQSHPTMCFDRIVSNPPFFVQALHSPKAARTLARHTLTLTFADLARIAAALLSPEGDFWILLPPREMSDFITHAQTCRLYPQQYYHLHHRPDAGIFRQVVSLGRNPSTIPQQHSFYIRTVEEDYSPEFVDLLRDYYLIF